MDIALMLSLTPSAPEVPTGTVLLFGGTTAPAGFLVCDASAVSRTTYATLFAVVGTNFGAGDGSTTFNLPNGNGNFPLGTTGTPGAVGGRSDALLNHSHVQSDVIGTFDNHSGGNVAAAFNPANAGIINQQHAGTSVSTTGNGTDTRPPFQTFRLIIKT